MGWQCGNEIRQNSSLSGKKSKLICTDFLICSISKCSLSVKMNRNLLRIKNWPLYVRNSSTCCLLFCMIAFCSLNILRPRTHFFAPILFYYLHQINHFTLIWKKISCGKPIDFGISNNSDLSWWRNNTIAVNCRCWGIYSIIHTADHFLLSFRKILIQKTMKYVFLRIYLSSPINAKWIVCSKFLSTAILQFSIVPPTLVYLKVPVKSNNKQKERIINVLLKTQISINLKKFVQ